MLRTRSRLVAATAFLAVVAALATCGRDTVAPRRPASLAVAAILPRGLNLAAFNLSIDHVRLIAVNSKGDTVFQQLFSFPANQSSLSLTADVPMAQSPETFQVTIELLSGTVLLFSGTQSVSLTSGPNNPTSQIPVSYSGPGQNVASLTLGPLDSLLTEGATLQMRVTATDGAGANVPSFYVSWSTSDTVAVPIDATGTLKAPLLRRTITVQARAFPDTTVKAATSLQFIPTLSAVSFDSGCAQSGLPGVQLAQPIVARVLGSDGLGVQGVTVQFAAVAGGSVATPSAVTDTGGRVRTLVTLPSIAGPAQFRATVTGLTAAVCGPTVLSAPPTQLAFKTQPATAIAGGAIGSFQVEVRDASGALVPSATNAVTVAIANNAGGGTLAGPQTVSAVAGVATFTGLSLDKVGVGYTLQATATGLSSVTSSAFDITAAALNNLAFTTQPVNLTAGTAFPTVVVTARDAFGNTVTSFANPVSLAFGSHPAGTTLTGTTSVAAVAGVATFSALGPLLVAGGYTLVASASGVGSTASSSFTVNPAPPVTLAFLGQPTSALAGAILTPAVIVVIKDSVGNVVTTATNAVTMAVNPASALLGGTVTRNAASGTATFTDLTVGLAGTGYTLVASATGLASATSAPFDILVRPPGVVWTNLQGGAWSNPANWSPARVPGTSDTASIVLPGTYNVTLDANAHVAFLAVGDTIGGISLSAPTGRSILIDSSAVILRAGVVVLSGQDTIGGAGNLTIQGDLTMESSAITTASVSNVATLQAAGTSSITGSFANSSTGALFVYSSTTGNATLTVASGFLNAGGIVLYNTDATPHNVTLAVPSGVLTNIPGSVLQSELGNAGGNRTLAATLDNQGGVLVSQTLTIDQAAATHGNSGTIILSGGDLNVILSGFRPAFSNESGGLIDVGTNKLAITNLSSGSFVNQPGGTLQGSGTIDIGTSSFIDDGFLNIGGTPGILSFVGPYTEGPSPAAMTVEIGGSPPVAGTTFDQFQVADTVNLQGGILNASFIGAYQPGTYAIIVVPVGKSILGDFQTKNLPLNPLSGAPCTGTPVGGTQYVITCP